MTLGDIRLGWRPGSGGGTTWYITARNGRMIAKSAVEYPDITTGLSAVDAICAQAADLTVQVFHGTSSVMWVWNAIDATDTVLVVGGRSYSRYGTCMGAGMRFVTVATAVADRGPVDVVEVVEDAASR